MANHSRRHSDDSWFLVSGIVLGLAFGGLFLVATDSPAIGAAVAVVFTVLGVEAARALHTLQRGGGDG